jgi:hypothetical protein
MCIYIYIDNTSVIGWDKIIIIISTTTVAALLL